VDIPPYPILNFLPCFLLSPSFNFLISPAGVVVMVVMVAGEREWRLWKMDDARRGPEWDGVFEIML
jgi:hypothetical protein